ncbi:efflux RND transporter permease subunit [Kaistia terrae]|uniref:Efflux RND transporter permease subunit n=1 Tax=Kaistia terrae TaxID=537017 RepID=A0ABW0PV39_9HYPH|nr:efflux RND transporter permease subunit [Kaistia terrae]MCX5576771.1 efflux RND transporter permease subunit [Kaistia terrae]
MPKEGAVPGGVSALSVRRPVLAIVVNLLIIIAGLAAYRGVEIRELPNIDQPVVTITTTYTGATPDTMDKEITSIIEKAAAGVTGWTDIQSQSTSGRSRVTVQFSDSVDINVAANDLRDAVGNAQRNLPDDADPPTIAKADTNGDAIMRLAVTSPTQKIEDLTKMVNDVIVDRLKAVDGVADVQINGDRSPSISIYIDPMRLASFGLTVADLKTALATVALDVPAGNLKDTNRNMFVRADASVKNADDVKAIRVQGDTRVGDVADVVFGPAVKSSSVQVNGRVGVGLGIVRQASSNTLEISTAVRKAITELATTLPKDVSVRVTSDDADFISGSFEEVERSLVLAIIIVIGVIYLFLGSLKSTLIPAVTVPVSLLGTIAAMYLMGFSLNILTLLALVLATGMVVDDAIVVLENITRRRAEGMGARAAAVLGAKQVFFAVISTTATLVAVFVPISFFKGTAGRLFSEFGFVLAFAVTLSGFVALTLAPMMASRLLGETDLGHGQSRNPLKRAMNAIGGFGQRLYERVLDFCLKAPAVIVLISVVFAGGAVLAFEMLPVQLTPQEDRGAVMIAMNTPQGSTVDYTQGQMALVTRAVDPLLKSGEATNIFSIAGNWGSPSNGFMMITLAPWGERSRSQAEISAELSQKLRSIPGAVINLRQGNSLGIRGGGQGLTFAVTGVEYDSISKAALQLIDTLGANPAFSNVQLNFDLNQPQLSVDIDRDRAADLGISVADIGTIVSTLLAGADMGNFYIGDDQIDITALAPDGMIVTPSDLMNVQVRTGGGAMVPLSSVISVSEGATSPTLARQSLRRAVPITATLSPGVDLGSAMDILNEEAAKQLPAGMNIVLTGEAATLNETSSGILQTFMFAVIIILLVMAAQFESFVSAAILFTTVPFGIAAGVYAILLSGGSLNIYTQIGLVMLVGLMAKNGILIVEFANQLRDEGQSVRDSIRNACLIRLRPVLMTMIATVLGGLPLILTGGAGSEARAALGWIMVGGLGVSALATLFLTPVSFLLLAGFSKPRIAEEQRLARELAEVEAKEALRREGKSPEVEPLPRPIAIAAE